MSRGGGRLRADCGLPVRGESARAPFAGIPGRGRRAVSHAAAAAADQGARPIRRLLSRTYVNISTLQGADPSVGTTGYSKIVLLSVSSPAYCRQTLLGSIARVLNG